MRDYESDFSRKQAVAATAVSANVVKVPAGDAGKGFPLSIQIDADGYSGAGSLAVEIQTAADAAMTGATVIGTLNVPNADLLKGGTVKVGTLPTGAKEYLRLNYVVAGSLSGGAITAGLKFHGDTAGM